MRVLVCGGRDYNDKDAVFRALWDYHKEDDIEIISGMAKGADHLGWMFAHTYDVPCHEFPANWDKEGKAAGPIRNQRMLDEGKPDLVLAFPGGRGTADMIKRAKAAGIVVREF